MRGNPPSKFTSLNHQCRWLSCKSPRRAGMGSGKLCGKGFTFSRKLLHRPGWMNNQADGLALCNSAIERARSLLPVDGNANIHL